MPTETIDITPDKSLMPKLGYAGYSAPQAIAELVDNAIDARIDGQPLTVSIRIQKDEITVADNGEGMNKPEISKSMVLAYSVKKGKLGEFGLGLKTACSSLGTRFKISSKKAGESTEQVIDYDEVRWLSESHDTWQIPLEVGAAAEAHHYTIVKISKLKVFYPNLNNYIRADLERRFAPFITSGAVIIKVNNSPCKPQPIDLLEDSHNQFELKDSKGNKLYGWYGLLKEGSQKGFYGFHTYRRGRMITTYDKIAIGEHPMIARIIGEIHLDHVPVTHNKREFIKSSAEYREAEQLLKQAFKELVKLARQKASQDTITPVVKHEIARWKDKIADALKTEDFKYYTSHLDPTTGKITSSNGEEAEVSVERREKSDKDTTEKPSAETDSATRERTPKESIKSRRHVVRIQGKSLEFNHHFAPLGSEESWKNYTYDKKKGIEIYTNTDFPAFRTTKDKVFYAVIHIAESLAEVFVGEAGDEPTNVGDLKELILRKAATTQEQWVDSH